MKGLKTLLAVVALLALCVSAAGAEGDSAKTQYDEAAALYEAENYAEALPKLLALGTYSDSAELAGKAAERMLADADEQAAYQLGVIYRGAGELAKARDAFVLAGDYEDASAQIYELAEALAVDIMYKRAELCMENGVYGKAQRLYQMLDGYQDSAEKATLAGEKQREALYLEARRIRKIQPELALILFSYLKGYEDSDAMAQELEASVTPKTLYDTAQELKSCYRYAEAQIGYALAKYRDSDEKAADLALRVEQENAFERAQMLGELGRYEESNDLFKTLGTYKNAHRMSVSRLSASRLRDDATTPLSDVFVAPDGSKHRYRMYKGVPLWIEAKAFCETLGGHLATMTTPEENEFVYKFMRDNGFLTAYFGLEDEARIGNWRWVTDEPFTYTNWHRGEPSRSGRERYGMYFYKHLDGTWNDAHFYEYEKIDPGCSFICEWDVE